MVARKPLMGTVAATVQEHGTGALNIDACRVAGVVPTTTQGQSSRQGEVYGRDQRDQREFVPAEGGRWPSNLVISHSDGCRQVGTKRVRSNAREDKGSGMGYHGDDSPRGAWGSGEEETTAAWECEKDCPVRLLDEQSGERPTGKVVTRKDTIAGHQGNVYGAQSRGPEPVELYGGLTNRRDGEPSAERRYDERGGTNFAPLPGERRHDEGGPSRFFPSFEGESSFRYQAKASRGERNAGLDGFREDAREGQSSWAGECNVCGCRMMLHGKPTPAVRPASSPASRVSPTCGHDDFRWTVGKPTQNAHPTVKPLALMRWLVRLVTPPDGTILDPFAGSGTTGCAAALEGFRFVGIEQDADYARIAEARIAFWAEHGEGGLEIVRRRETAEAVREETRDSGQLELL